MKVGGRMSMAAVIESTERDALRQAMKPEIEMSLVEFAEKIAPFPLSEFQKQLINEYGECLKENEELDCVQASYIGRDFILRMIEEWKRQNRLVEHRCQRCNRLLGKFNGQAEIKCPKCGKINRIGVYKDLAEQKGH